MTLIVATPTEMAADSFVGNEEVKYRLNQKIFTRGKLAVGVAGSLKALRAIKYIMSGEDYRVDIDLATPDKLADYFAVTIKDAEYQILIANGETLWESNEAGDTFEIKHFDTPDIFGAIGQGYQYALGYMYCDSRNRPLGALYAGVAFCPLVSLPATVTVFDSRTNLWTPSLP